MTEFWLVRHGETVWNQEGRLQGSIDIELNENGLLQAGRLAEQLKNVNFQAIFSSPLKRACKTAEIISAQCKLPVQTDPRLAEISMGLWEGLTVSELRMKYPGQLEKRNADPVHFCPQGGESTFEISIRLRQTVDEISRQYTEEPVLLVSHGLALATLVCMAKGIPFEKVFKQVPDNAAPVIIEWPIVNYLWKPGL